jgi:hypothetical protein
MADLSHALKAVEVCSKSIGSEGYFTREAERVFPPYFASHCSAVTETSHLAIPTHALQAVQVWSKSVGNEEHAIPEAEAVPRTFLSLHCRGVTLTIHYKQCKFPGNRLVMRALYSRG